MAIPDINYYSVWADISDRIAPQHESGAAHLGNMSNAYKGQAACKEAFKELLLTCFLDKLIDEKSTGWREFDRVSAIQHELMRRHDWFPKDTCEMSNEELLIIFHEDLRSLTLPDQAYDACRGDLSRWGVSSLLEHHQ